MSLGSFVRRNNPRFVVVAGIFLPSLLAVVLLVMNLAGFGGWPLVGVIAITLIIILCRRLVVSRREADRFKQRPCTDDGIFLAQINIVPTSPESKIALQAREVFAELGTVPPNSLKANDRFYPDMQELPFYDSIDHLEIIFRLEKKLNIKIVRADAEPIMALFCRPPSGTVGDAVISVVNLWKRAQK